jgi:hypothetical protein
MVVCVSSPLGISFGCAVRLLRTVAADLRVRVRLTPGARCWQKLELDTPAQHVTDVEISALTRSCTHYMYTTLIANWKT